MRSANQGTEPSLWPGQSYGTVFLQQFVNQTLSAHSSVKSKLTFFLCALTMFDFDFCNALPVRAQVGSGTITAIYYYYYTRYSCREANSQSFWFFYLQFLADHTNGHAYGTMLCPSVVCLLSVCNVCIVAKRYVSPKKTVQRSKQGCPTATQWYQFGPPYDLQFPKYQWNGYYTGNRPVFFNLFAVAEPLQAVKSLAEPHAVTL